MRIITVSLNITPMENVKCEFDLKDYELERQQCVQKLAEINREKFLSRKPKVKSPKRTTQVREFSFSKQAPRSVN